MTGQTVSEGMAPEQRPEPVPRAERIEAIDALRGLALFGVLMVNLITAFRVSIFTQFVPGPGPQTALDRFVDGLVSVGLDMKAWSLFAVLFGIGLAIQFDRLKSRPDRAVLLCRRLGALLLFGLIHLFLVWNGDILTEYAIAGFVLLPLLFAPRWIVGLASAAFLVFYALTPLLHLPIPFPEQAELSRLIAEANATYGRGDYAQVVQFNIREIPALVPLHLFNVARTLGLFTLGIWLWRCGLFHTGREVFGRLGLIGVVLGLLLTLAGQQSGVAGQLAPIVLALGYAGVALLLATGNRTRRLVAWAVPLGRTAFSNYLLQSVIFGLIFYGYGLGQFGRLSPSTAFVIGLAVYSAQVAISTLWLRHFQFGPMEWLWRAIMYGTKPSMLRAFQRTHA